MAKLPIAPSSLDLMAALRESLAAAPLPKEDSEARTRADLLAFSADLARMKHRAGQLGLWKTMRALDRAAKAVGYEIAELLPREEAPHA
jgi:hypothetical protein